MLCLESVFAQQAAALRMQNLDQGMEEFENRLQHSALVVAACVGRIHTCFSDSKWAILNPKPVLTLGTIGPSETLSSKMVHSNLGQEKLQICVQKRLPVGCKIPEML